MAKIRPDYRLCKHDNGFTALPWQGQPTVGMFVCNLNCGYFINFDPFEYPNGIAYVTEPPARFDKGPQQKMKTSK